MAVSIGSEHLPACVPLHAVSVVVSLDENGEQCLSVIHDSECPRWMAMGMLHAALIDQDWSWTSTNKIAGDDDGA